MGESRGEDKGGRQACAGTKAWLLEGVLSACLSHWNRGSPSCPVHISTTHVFQRGECHAWGWGWGSFSATFRGRVHSLPTRLTADGKVHMQHAKTKAIKKRATASQVQNGEKAKSTAACMRTLGRWGRGKKCKSKRERYEMQRHRR